MKPVPLLLLLSSFLLSSHLHLTAGRPRSLPGWLDGSSRLQAQQLEDMLLRAAAAGDSTTSEFLSENLMKLLQNKSQEPLSALTPEEETEDEAMRAAAQLLKRSEDPPLSIDLTHHMMRYKIAMDNLKHQREQALLNRKVLDEIGK